MSLQPSQPSQESSEDLLNYRIYGTRLNAFLSELLTNDYKDKQAILRLVAYHMQVGAKHLRSKTMAEIKKSSTQMLRPDYGLAGNLISATDLERIITDYLKTIEVTQARILARVLINQ